MINYKFFFIEYNLGINRLDNKHGNCKAINNFLEAQNKEINY